MPSILVPGPLKLLAGVGGVLVGAGLLSIIMDLVRVHRPGRLGWEWLVPLGFLGMKALGQIVISAIPTLDWASMHGLRVLYLHAMLLGFVTLGLTAAARSAWPVRGNRVLPTFYVSVGLVMVSLIMFTPIFPVPWSAFEAAAWVSLLPVVAAGWMAAETVSDCRHRL